MNTELLDNEAVTDFLDSLASSEPPIADIKVNKSKSSVSLRGTWDGLQKCLSHLRGIVAGNTREELDTMTQDPPLATASAGASAANDDAETEIVLHHQSYKRDFTQVTSVRPEVEVAVDPKVMKNVAEMWRKQLTNLIDAYKVQLTWTPGSQFVKIHGGDLESVSAVTQQFKQLYDDTERQEKRAVRERERERERAVVSTRLDVVDYSASKSELQQVELTYVSPEGITLVIRHNDITEERVGAIVNSSNEGLDHLHGVAAAIAAKGGKDLREDSQNHVNICGELDVGSAVYTRPGDLPCAHVIHTVGPRWTRFSDRHDLQLLNNACINSLRLADQLQVDSVAMPAISSGIFGMPIELCAEVLFNSFDEFSRRNPLSSVREVRFVNNDRPTVDAFCQEFRNRYRSTSNGFQPTARSSYSSQRRRPPGSYSLDDDDDYYEMRRPQIPLQSQPKGFRREGDVGMSGNYQPSHGYGRGRGLLKTTSSQSSQPGIDSRHRGWPSDQSMRTKSSGSHSQKHKSAVNDDVDSQSDATVPDDKSDQCSICLGPIQEPKTLPICKHTFCTLCLEQAFQVKPSCPICQTLYGTQKGDQPDGRMDYKRHGYSLPGFQGSGTIVISYSFRGGIQKPEHPNPGSPYHGTTRVAYLPDTKEGNRVLELLQRAFDARLVFTIGASATTGAQDQITWNDIHHKTSMSGGPTTYGYPDPTYLTRVKQELADKGIK